MNSLGSSTSAVFDTVITDISAETIKTNFSLKLGHEYLSSLS